MNKKHIMEKSCIFCCCCFIQKRIILFYNFTSFIEHKPKCKLKIINFFFRETNYVQNNIFNIKTKKKYKENKNVVSIL